MKTAIAILAGLATITVASATVYVATRPVAEAPAEQQQAGPVPNQPASGAFNITRTPGSGSDILRLYGQVSATSGTVVTLGTIPNVSGRTAIIGPTGDWQILLEVPPTTPHGIPVTVSARYLDGTSANYTATIP